MHKVRLGYLIAGGACLAALAGGLNAAFLLLLGISVSHLSGDVARFAIDVGAQDGLSGRRTCCSARCSASSSARWSRAS